MVETHPPIMGTVWIDTALLWTDLQPLGLVLIGRAGFVWWDRAEVHLAPFPVLLRLPNTLAVKTYDHWEMAKSHPRRMAMSRVIRFAQTGHIV